MEASLSSPKTLRDSISQFGLLSLADDTESGLVHRFYHNIHKALKLIGPVLEEIPDCQVGLDEQLHGLLKELGAVVDNAKELIECWHRMRSKVYFALQIESLIKKIQISGLEICRLMDSWLQSNSDPTKISCLQHCVPVVREMASEQISDTIKEAIASVQEKTVPNPQSLVKIAEFLNLTSNEELLLEAVALKKVEAEADKAKRTRESDYIDGMISLVTHMHNCLMKIEQCQSIDGVSIPADFCCPLSLKLMSDPVIVASGQTYERVFIKKWVDQGLTVCPKTRQTLSNLNLVPNYTVKALIVNWCEINNIKLPDPVKLSTLNSSPSSATNSGFGTPPPRSPESSRSMGSQKRSVTSNGTLPSDRLTSISHLNSVSEGAEVSRRPVELNLNGVTDTEVDAATMSLSCSELENVSNDHHNSAPVKWGASEPSTVTSHLQGHHQSASISSGVSSNDDLPGVGDVAKPSRMLKDPTNHELTSDIPTSATSREPEFSSRLAETRSLSQTRRRPSERVVQKIVSSPALDTRVDLSGIETQVWNLIEDLKNSSVDVQRAAVHELRLLAKHNMDNRIVIANCGAISHLINLLRSPDMLTQEHAVTALLNLSLSDNNKMAIANAGAIEPLILVLQTGSAEAKENSAATLFSLSVMEENKLRIGQAGAVGPLVELLGNGTPRGKKDAATALFNLSIYPDNKSRIVRAGAVRYLVELMDPATGMVDKAVAVLSNLATIHEGRVAIGLEGGIPVLVEVVELGSSRGKEHAAAALLQLCTNSSKFCNQVLQEGAVPPLVALAQSGTARAKEKAQSLLRYFRNQRHNNAARA